MCIMKNVIILLFFYRGNWMKGTWLTPEEIAWRKNRNKTIGYAFIPVFAIMVGVIISLVAN